MHYTVEHKNDVSILRVHHERLDTEVAHDLKVELLKLVSGKNKGILLDLKQVHYADSTGLGAILFGIRQGREQGRDLKLVHLNERVLNLIRIAKLDDVIESFDNEDEALASFQQAAG